MAKILGIGGVFFKSKNPEKLGLWYEKWLNVKIDSTFGGSVFSHSSQPESSYSVWAPFKESTGYFSPSNQSFMINFIVDNLDEALNQVKQGGGTLIGDPEESEFGSFGWFIDPDGNKIELWQPNLKQ